MKVFALSRTLGAESRPGNVLHAGARSCAKHATSATRLQGSQHMITYMPFVQHGGHSAKDLALPTHTRLQVMPGELPWVRLGVPSATCNTFSTAHPEHI